MLPSLKALCSIVILEFGSVLNSSIQQALCLSPDVFSKEEYSLLIVELESSMNIVLPENVGQVLVTGFGIGYYITPTTDVTFIYQGAHFFCGARCIVIPLSEDDLPYYLEIYFKHTKVSIEELKYLYQVAHDQALPPSLFVTSFSLWGRYVRKTSGTSDMSVQYSENEFSLRETLQNILYGDECLI